MTYAAIERTAAISTSAASENESPPDLAIPRAFPLRIEDCGLRIYDARAARRRALVAFVATGRGAAFATFARGAAVAVRAFIMKQRSSARSTRPSIAAADSRITS